MKLRGGSGRLQTHFACFSDWLFLLKKRVFPKGVPGASPKWICGFSEVPDGALMQARRSFSWKVSVSPAREHNSRSLGPPGAILEAPWSSSGRPKAAFGAYPLVEKHYFKKFKGELRKHTFHGFWDLKGPLAPKRGPERCFPETPFPGSGHLLRFGVEFASFCTAMGGESAHAWKRQENLRNAVFKEKRRQEHPEKTALRRK